MQNVSFSGRSIGSPLWFDADLVFANGSRGSACALRQASLAVAVDGRLTIRTRCVFPAAVRTQRRTDGRLAHDPTVPAPLLSPRPDRVEPAMSCPPPRRSSVLWFLLTGQFRRLARSRVGSRLSSRRLGCR